MSDENGDEEAAELAQLKARVAAKREAEDAFIAHLDRLDREVQLALAHWVTFSRLNAQAPLFPRSRAAHVFRLTIEAHLFLTALALGRLWDNDSGSFAIPAMVTRLRRPHLLRGVIAERLSSQRRGGQHTRVGYLNDFPDDLRTHLERDRHARGLDEATDFAASAIATRDEIIAECCEIMDSNEFRHLNEMRNTFLAHASEISRSGRKDMEAGKEVRTPYIEELNALTAKTAAIVEKIQYLCRQHIGAYGEHEEAFGVHVDDFIERCFPRSEPDRTL